MSISTAPEPEGFSLIEILIAMAILLGVGLIVFQMFAQNERVFRDQSLILEMQQNARAVASMIADDVRMAGQGVPVYAASHQAQRSEATQAFLEGTNADNIRFRAGIRNGRAVVADSPPLSYTIGNAATTSVDSAQVIAGIVGNNTGRHVYLSGPGANSWTWIRAEIAGIPVGASSLQLIPRQVSSEGGSFQATPGVSLEEGISYQLSNGVVRRGTMTTSTSLTAPTFTLSAVGDNFTTLRFSYYDVAGAELNPSTLELRAAIKRVDFVLEASTSGPLSNGSGETFAVSMSVHPRNLEIH